MFVPIGSNSGESYQVQRSLRFRASASAYATYSPASGSGNTKAVFSLWVKRGQLGSTQNLLNVGSTSSDYHALFFDASDQLLLYHVIGGVTTYGFTLSRKFRDPSAHTHIVVAIDTTQPTPSDRLKVWVNGNQETAGSFTNYALNTNIFFFNAGLHSIGRFPTAGNYFDGYVSEFVGLHNQTGKTAADFGQFDPTSNQWIAKKYTGAYGSNGFYLDFSDPTSTTTLMLDRSGSGNNWTPNNISLTAGATYDSMLDVPLGGGGNERGNYATISPLSGDTAATISNANLTVSGGDSSGNSRYGSIGVYSEKWYWEQTVTTAGAGGQLAGVSSDNTQTTSLTGVLGYYYNGNKYSGATVSAYGAAFDTGDVIGIELDMYAGTLVFRKNNTPQGTAFSGLTGTYYPLARGGNPSTAAVIDMNFGQRPFAYTPPTGFKALNTGNLTDTTPISSGSFTGNLSADGPCIWCNGTPETLTINGNAVTWGTHADKLATGFKIRTASSSYNSSGTNTWTATFPSPSSQAAFKYQNAKGNP